MIYTKKEALELCLINEGKSNITIPFIGGLSEITELLGRKNYTIYPVGVATKKITSVIHKEFPDKIGNSQKLCTWLLSRNNLVYCSRCELVHNKSNFAKNSARSSGISSWCRDCTSFDRKVNPTYWSEYMSARRASSKLAIPKWADREEIRNFYSKCPNGYHVDHKVPLNGKEVCGLHTINNLQYLSEKDNISKSNKLLDVFISSNYS